jgi:protein TonB
MLDRAIVLSLCLLCPISLASCQMMGGGQSEEVGAVESATAAYLAYERGDCDGVHRSARREQVESWQPTELRHSMLLVYAFCEELAGEDAEALETYRGLIREAPLSFAAEDARERLRILRLQRNDPDYAEWVEGARERASHAESSRIAVQRVPANFPPLAQQAGIEGFAVVEFGVTPRGDTDAPVIVDSEPPLLFEGAALRAVREWRYEEDPDAGKTERQAIRIVFKPEDDSPPPPAAEPGEQPPESSPTTP